MLHRHSLGIVLVLASIGTTLLPTSQPADDPVCGESLVPVVWPLGLDGFQSRRLLYSHGQYEQHDSYAADVHRGIDIAGEAGELVYAVQDGIVDRRYDDGGSGYGYLYIRDAESSTSSDPTGWKYMHLKNFKVAESDTVVRDQVLGEVVSFPKAKCFDHVHLQRITGSAPLGTTAVDAGNALPLLPSRADGAPPERRSFESPHPSWAGFLFYEDGTDVPEGPTPTAGRPVDIVARVAERFPGASSPTCSTSVCAPPAGPPDLAPMKMSLTIFEETVTSSSSSSSSSASVRTHRTKVFTNTIDLRVAIGLSGAGGKLEQYIYDPDSRGDYDDRYLLVCMTNCQEDGLGAFAFIASTSYRLQLVLEDASGNATLFERSIDIP